MIILIIIVVVVGYGFTFLSLFFMNLVYSKYLELDKTQKETQASDPGQAQSMELRREMLSAAQYTLCEWAALLSAIGTTVLLVILAIIALIQSFG